MGDQTRKRKHQQWNQKVKQKSVEAGVSGLFFTCEAHEKQALQEAYSIIDEILEEPKKNNEEVKEEEAENDDEDDVSDMLKKACREKSGKKNGEKKRRCIQRPTGVKNCIFVSVKDANIIELAEKIVDLTQQTPRCRFLQRVIPVEHTFAIDLKILSEIIMRVVSENLKMDADGSYPTYSVEFKARNNDSVGKNIVLEMMDDAIQAFAPTAKASLNHAKITFFIQISRTTTMVGTCRNFYDRRKYSMRPVKKES